MTRGKSGGKVSEVQTTLIGSFRRGVTEFANSFFGNRDGMEFEIAHEHEAERVSSSTSFGERRKGKGRASEIIDVTADEGGAGPSKRRDYPTEEANALMTTLRQGNKTLQRSKRHSAPGPAFTPGRNTLEKDKKTPVRGSGRQSTGNSQGVDSIGKSRVDRSREPLMRSANSKNTPSRGSGWSTTQSRFDADPNIQSAQAAERRRREEIELRAQPLPGPSTQRQRLRKRDNDASFAPRTSVSPNKSNQYNTARYSEVNEDDNDFFMLAGRRADAHDTVAPAHPQRSRTPQRSSSPQKPFSPVKGPAPKSAGFHTQHFHKTRDLKEPEETIEDIENPDDDSDVEFVDRPEHSASSSNGKRQGHTQSSPIKPPEKPRGLLSRMQPKDPVKEPPSQARTNGPIRSSNIKSGKPAESHATADVEYARSFNFEQHVPADMISVKQTHMALGSRSGGRGAQAEIPWPFIPEIMVCNGSEHPLFVFSVCSSNSGTSMPQRRQLFESLGAFMSVPFSEGESGVLRFFVAFKAGSSEAHALLELVVSIAKKLSIAVQILDDNAAFALKGSNPPVARPDSRIRSRAAAERKREEQQVSSRPASEAPSTGRAGAKGKGRATEEDPTQSKLSFKSMAQSHVPLRRSARQSGVRAYTELDDDDEVSEQKRPTIPPLTAEKRNELLFEYPTSGRAEVQITGGDRYRIESDDFLNDTLILFGLRNVIQGLSDPAKSRVHLLNSFFYEKITSRKGKVAKTDEKWPAWPAYESVKKWTKNADIFNKDWIVVPINENLHWYLAVIYNPAGILRERDPEAEDKPSASPTRSNSPSRTPANKEAPAEDMVPDSQPTGHGDAPVFNDEDLDELTDTEAALPPQRLEKSADPLDCMDQDEGVVRDAVEDKQIRAGVENMTLDTEPPSSPVGQPILTPSMMAAEAQHAAALGRASGQSSPAKDAAEEMEKPEKLDLPSKPDLKIWNSGDCWIFTFDSLGGGHKSVAEYLDRWLRYEARDKQVLAEDANYSSAKYSEARVPTQPNFHDCGLYMIHFCKQLLQNSEEVVNFMQRTPPRGATSPARKAWEEDMAHVWHKQGTDSMRRDFVQVIDEVTAEYRSIIGERPRQAEEEQEEDELPDQSDLEMVNEGPSVASIEMIPAAEAVVDGPPPDAQDEPAPEVEMKEQVEQADQPVAPQVPEHSEQFESLGPSGQPGSPEQQESLEQPQLPDQLEATPAPREENSPSPAPCGRPPARVETSVEPHDFFPVDQSSTTPNDEPGPDAFGLKVGLETPTQRSPFMYNGDEDMTHANVSEFPVSVLRQRSPSPSASTSDMASKTTVTADTDRSRDGTLESEAPKPAGYREEGTPSRARWGGNHVLVAASSSEDTPFNFLPLGSDGMLEEAEHDSSQVFGLALVADNSGQSSPAPRFESLPPPEEIHAVDAELREDAPIASPPAMALGESSTSRPPPARRDSHDSLTSLTDDVGPTEPKNSQPSFSREPPSSAVSVRFISPERPSQDPPKSSPHQASVTYSKRNRAGKGRQASGSSVAPDSSSPRTRSKRDSAPHTTPTPAKKQRTRKGNKAGDHVGSVSTPIEVDDD